MQDILSIQNLTVRYPDADTPAVDSVSLRVPQGSIVAVVGESGSGKSTLLRSVIGLLSGGGQIIAGSIRFRNTELVGLPPKAYRGLRGGEISMIFQDAASALDARKKVGYQYAEALCAHRKLTQAQAKEMGLNMLSRMALPDPKRIWDSYPFELSGGMVQRVAIAMSVSNHSELLLADEPTSALDVTVQAQVVKTILHLRDEHGKSVMLVTHNLGVAAYMADFIAVMRGGRVVEWGQTDALLRAPTHAYTRQLIACAPSMEVAELDN